MWYSESDIRLSFKPVLSTGKAFGRCAQRMNDQPTGRAVLDSGIHKDYVVSSEAHQQQGGRRTEDHLAP